MNKKLKILTLSLVSTFLMTNASIPVSAKVINNPSKNISTIKNGITKEKVDNMSDKEFSKFVHDYVVNSSSTTSAKNDLSKVGVDLEVTPQSGTGLKSIASSDVTCSVYSFKRSGSDIIYLQASLNYKTTPTNCGTYDVLSVEWNPKNYTFYDVDDSYNGNYCTVAYV